MKTLTSSKASSRPITTLVRERIAGSGEPLWRLEDFRDLPFTAVAQVLSRLTRTGKLERLSKGGVAMGEAMDRAIQKLLDSPPGFCHHQTRTAHGFTLIWNCRLTIRGP